MRRATGTFGIRLVSLAMQFAGSIMIARLLGVAEFGVYAYAFTWVVIVGLMLSLGVTQLATRELPRFVALGQGAAFRRFVALLFGLIVGIGALCAVLIAGLDGLGYVDVAVGWYWLAIGIVIHGLILGCAAVLQSLQQVVKSQLIETILRQGIFLAALGGLFIWGASLSAFDVFRLSVLLSVPVLALMIWVTRRAVRGITWGPLGTPDTVSRRVWMIAALPLLVMLFASQMQTNLDVLLIGALADADDVGRYRTASRGADLMFIATGIAIQVLGPMLAAALTKDDRTEAQALITQSTLIATLLGGAICVVMFGGASVYLGLFGPDFVSGAGILRILVAAQMIGILCGPVTVVLITLGFERLVLMVSIGVLTLNLCLNLILIPLYGPIGAAWATFIAVITLQVVQLIFVTKRSGFDPTLRPLLKP